MSISPAEWRDYVGTKDAPVALIVACGSRSWTDTDAIRRVLVQFPPTTLLHGGARGADTIAGAVAAELGFRVEMMRADWRTLGRRAGVERNRRMLDRWPDVVLAFWDGHSPGTADTIREARKRGLVVVVTSPDAG